jgi:replicative DNA helicase
MTKRKLPEYGLLQPQSVELEEAILGACMLESEAINLVVDILTPECFYKEANQILFMAIIDLYKRSSPIDILTVCQKLKSLDKLEEVGGAYYISSLTNRIASSSNIEYHSRIVVQQFLKREMIRLSTENIKNAYDDTLDVFDTFQKGITKIEGAISGVIKYDVKQIGKVHEKVIAESIFVAQSGIKSGVPTGFRNIDNFTNGWQKTDLIILAGRPAMGKSVCGLAFALNPAIRDNIATAVFSLEMSNDQLVGRAQSSLSGINSSRIIKKQLTVDEVLLVESRCLELNTAPIYIDDTPSLSLIDLKGKARKLVRDKKVRLIVIDYLQLMTVDAGKGNREQEVSMISKGLKALAKELDVPIIALSQLSRAVESRGGDKKPMLSDLRESGSIEQDADMVIFCYRPEYYGIETYEIGGETLECNGLMSLIVAKHRAGSLGELRLGFNGDLTKLENYESFKSNQSSGYTKAEPTTNTNSKMPENNDFLNEQKQSEETEDDDDLPF